MNGAKSSNGERIKAAQLVQAIRDEREGRAKVHVAEQGDGDKVLFFLQVNRRG
jgi:hypothetical protein